MQTAPITTRKQEFLDERTARLEAGYDALTSAENFTAYLKMMARLHKYSWHNTLLIWMQRPTATHCAGYQDWRALERQVRKGETGIAIYAPMLGKIDPETGLRPIYGFRKVYVFDISQTDGPDLPTHQLITDYKAAITDFPQVAQWDKKLRKWCKTAGIPLKSAKLDESTHGFYSVADQSITLSSTISKTQQFHTLLHELAHHLVYTDNDENLRKMSKSNHELTAESVAYVAAAFCGFDTEAMTLPYLGLYTVEVDQLKTVMPMVKHLAGKLIGVLES